MDTPTGMKLKVPAIKPSLKTGDNTTNYNDYDDYDDDDADEDMHQDETQQQRKRSNKKKSKNNNNTNTRTLKWDEDKIKEHDQLRGTRMKIDEPNTPYAHYDSGSETDGSFSSATQRSVRSINSTGSGGGNNETSQPQISWDALTNKLEAHAAVKDQVYPPSSPSVASSSHNGGGGGGGVSGGTVTTDDDDDDDDEEQQKRDAQKVELKRLEFQELRKRHYNEMEVVRRFRRDHPDGVPTSNGSENGNENGNGHNDNEENDGDDENE